MNILSSVVRFSSAVLIGSWLTVSHAANYDDAVLAFENRDYASALALVLPLAEQQDIDAMTLLGRVYDEGFNKPNEAFPWFKKAAEQGNAQAQLELAELYDAGEGVAQNTEQAIEWYEKAAAQGHDEAQLALAIHHQEDLDDNKTALTLYLKAAQQGNATAQYRLGLLYLGDTGISTDKLKAWLYFSLAAHKVPEAAQAKDVLELEMSNAQLLQAQMVLKQWQSSR
ncbi:tetratricopeptide repeat protein [Agitococcus lubricus]|uniref:TPR repeat protein n=1 Tax=Agitococcus lubricus TaxID=1077255 RepID=A0A2T5IVJ1_9GAMM|nr:tetratricopeptide repeat protein [Agitococcus lubricus]PTQ87883.1 hypothetical protein C8N29_11649 [Agitococcus lubricus]